MYTAARLASTGRAAVFLRVKPSRKNAFVALRRVRQTQNKNNLSAEYAQSVTEGILNRPTRKSASNSPIFSIDIRCQLAYTTFVNTD